MLFAAAKLVLTVVEAPESSSDKSLWGRPRQRGQVGTHRVAAEKLGDQVGGPWRGQRRPGPQGGEEARDLWIWNRA